MREQRRQFYLVLTIVFLGFLGISMPYLIFPALFLNPAYSILPASWSESSQVLFLGLSLAAYPLGGFVGSPILGALSDDFGRKKILSSSLLIASFFYLLTGIAISQGWLGLLVFSRFGAGVMEGNVAIARAMGVDSKSLSKQETFGKINASISTAYLLGPLLGGLMIDKSVFQGFTPSTPFYGICVLFLALACLSWFVLKRDPISNGIEKRTFWQRINLIKRMAVLFSNKRLQFLVITSTCFTLGVDIFYEFGPVYLTNKWLLSPAQLVFYNGILCFGLILGNGWLPKRVASRLPKRTAIIGSMGGFALLLIGITWVDSVVFMMTLFALCGLVIGLAVTFITVKISDSAPDTIQGEVMGVQLALRVLGDAVICLFGGVLLLLSFKIILVFASLLCMATIVYYRLRVGSYFSEQA